jgi:hypothetical protein
LRRRSGHGGEESRQEQRGTTGAACARHHEGRALRPPERPARCGTSAQAACCGRHWRYAASLCLSTISAERSSSYSIATFARCSFECFPPLRSASFAPLLRRTYSRLECHSAFAACHDRTPQPSSRGAHRQARQSTPGAGVHRRSSRPRDSSQDAHAAVRIPRQRVQAHQRPRTRHRLGQDGVLQEHVQRASPSDSSCGRCGS